MDRLEFAAEYQMQGDTLSGIAYVFGTRGTKDGITHEFDVHAFDEAINGGRVFAFYAHDKTKPLGIPTLRVAGRRLHVELTLGHQTYAEDLRANMALGLMNEMSVGVIQDQYEDRRTSKGMVRYHTKAGLFDVSPVWAGTMPDTKALLHSRGIESRASQLVRARARVMEVYR